MAHVTEIEIYIQYKDNDLSTWIYPACDYEADQQTANHIITECPPIVHQMVSMA